MASNTLITPDMIAREALMNLKSNLVMSKTVYRGYESEWTGRGFKIGDTVSVRRPVQYTIRSGKTASAQDTTEGKFNIQVNSQKGVDMEFDSDELTLDIEQFSERYLAPAAIRIAHEVDKDGHALYDDVSGWAGTPGQTVNSYGDISEAAKAMDKDGVPLDNRHLCLSPDDYHAVASAQTALGSSDRLVESAYERARLQTPVAGFDVYMSQQVVSHTRGDAAGTILVDGANQETTYALTKDTGTQTLNVDGLTSGTEFKAGDVFTIAGVFAVNPQTGEARDDLQQFVVTADSASSSGTSDDIALTIAPAIIVSGAYKTCSAAPADNAAITVLGTADTAYRQNLAYHRNAFALVMVPLVRDLPGCETATVSDPDTGLSIRYARQYDIANDKVIGRLDVLYGWKTIDERLATRLSGTA